MGIEKDHFKRRFLRYNIDYSDGEIRIYVPLAHIGNNLDLAQEALDQQIWHDMQQYMPFQTNTLRANTQMLNEATRGEVYKYDPRMSYGHYQYEGIVYVDPVTRAAGFYIDEVGWRSRRGVQKVPSERKLTYQNPQATAHWDETAFRNHSKDWINVVRRAMRQK